MRTLRAPFQWRTLSYCLLTSFFPVVTGCNHHPIESVKLIAGEEKPEKFIFQDNRDVDILFVIDNSGSMAEEQGKLAENFGRFIEVLEREEVRANYRIAITTTDMGNQYFPRPSGPERGHFVLQSCRDRLTQFIYEDSVNGNIDWSETACTNHCQYTDEDLKIVPTTTEKDSQARPRLWIEKINGRSNLPEHISTADAFACFGPMGVDGNGFEEPLEAQYFALARSLSEGAEDGSTPNSNGDPEQGFVREDALLLVVHITDEADCSVRPDAREVFDANGDRVFWSGEGMSSAICWNAGVDCDDAGDGTLTCFSADKDISGAPVATNQDPMETAVLYPIERYLGQLEAIAKLKGEENGGEGKKVFTALIGGVDEHGNASYRDVSNSDPDFQANFGVGPGCRSIDVESGEEQRAVPPVRLLEVVKEMQGESPEPGLFSICSDDYSPALESIADEIRRQFKPACFQYCVADANVERRGLQPSCDVKEHIGEFERDLVECERDQNAAGSPYLFVEGKYVVPEGEPACYVYRVDQDGSLNADPHDDMTLFSSDPNLPETVYCAEQGYNLELHIERSPDFPREKGSEIELACSLSQDREVDCPSGG